MTLLGFSGGASGKEPTSQCSRHKREQFDPGSGRSPGRGEILDPLQNSCLENFMERGAWQVTIHGVTEFDTTEVP